MLKEVLEYCSRFEFDWRGKTMIVDPKSVPRRTTSRTPPIRAAMNTFDLRAFLKLMNCTVEDAVEFLVRA